MKQERIDRINELAHKAKTEGLTEEELAERDILRREYIDAIKSTLCGHLDNTYIVDMAGHKHPLKKKRTQSRRTSSPSPNSPDRLQKTSAPLHRSGALVSLSKTS